MTDFILFLLGMVPWPVWVLLALAILGAVQFLWGWKAALGAAIGLLPIAGYFWGGKQATERAEAKRDREARDHVRIRNEVDDDVSELGAQDVDDKLARWNRD